MADLNNCSFCGRLVADCVVKTAKSTGKPFITFRIAVNGYQKDDVLYLSCIKSEGANLAQYLTKGKQVAVSGSLKSSKYTKSNIEVEGFTLSVSNIQLITVKEQSYNEYTSERHLGVQPQQPVQNGGPENFVDAPFDDSDIPF